MPAPPASPSPSFPTRAASRCRIRTATLADVSALVDLEARAFAGDRITRRAFVHLLTRANAVVLAAVDDTAAFCGSAVVLFRKGSLRARLYSIAVVPERKGKGLGAMLLADVERVARGRGAKIVGLEVRVDAPATQAFYHRHGYRSHASRPCYYEDGATAICMEKVLPTGATELAAGHQDRR